MQRTFTLPVFLLIWMLGWSAPVSAEALPEVLSLARRAVGSEQTLSNVDTLRFEGKVTADGSDFEASIEIIFKKPASSWLRIETPGRVEITANNSHEGYVLHRDRQSGKETVRVLPGAAVARLANGAWERLHFFANPRSRFGRIELEGMVRVEDTVCEKVVFHYPGKIWSARYFDKDTGRLLMTMNDSGLTYIEEGGMRASGITFPAKVHVRDGESERRVIHFERITVNGPVDTALFEFPSGRRD